MTSSKIATTSGTATIAKALTNLKKAQDIAQQNLASTSDAAASGLPEGSQTQHYAIIGSTLAPYVVVSPFFSASLTSESDCACKAAIENTMVLLNETLIEGDEYSLGKITRDLASKMQSDSVPSATQFISYASECNQILDTLDQISNSTQQRIESVIHKLNTRLLAYKDLMGVKCNFHQDNAGQILSQRNPLLYNISECLKLDQINLEKFMPPLSVSGQPILTEQAVAELRFAPALDQDSLSPGALEIYFDGQRVANIPLESVGGEIGGCAESIVEIKKQKAYAIQIIKQIANQCNSKTGAVLGATSQYTSKQLDLNRAIDWDEMTFCAVQKDGTPADGFLNVTVSSGQRTPEEQVAEINRISSIYSAQRVTVGQQDGLQNIVLDPKGMAFITGYKGQQVRLAAASIRKGAGGDQQLNISNAGVVLESDGMQLCDLGLQLAGVLPADEIYLALEVAHDIGGGEMRYSAGGLVGKLNLQGQIVFTPVAGGGVDVAGYHFEQGGAATQPSRTNYLTSSIDTTSNVVKIGGLECAACIVGNVPKVMQTDVLLMKDGKLVANFHNQTAVVELGQSIHKTAAGQAVAKTEAVDCSAHNFTISLNDDVIYSFVHGVGVDTPSIIYFSDFNELARKTSTNSNIPFKVSGALDACVFEAKSPGAWGNNLSLDINGATTQFVDGTDNGFDVKIWHSVRCSATSSKFESSVAEAINGANIAIGDKVFADYLQASSYQRAALEEEANTANGLHAVAETNKKNNVQQLYNAQQTSTENSATAALTEISTMYSTLADIFAAVIKQQQEMIKRLLNAFGF